MIEEGAPLAEEEAVEEEAAQEGERRKELHLVFMPHGNRKGRRCCLTERAAAVKGRASSKISSQI